jgi:hypothetical protein
MGTVSRYIGQGIVYAVFAVTVWYFSAAPAYTYLESGKAVIRIAFAHAANPVSECRTRSREELMKLAPNMRQPRVCPRERVPIHLELDLDDERMLQAVLPPSGLSGDGSARFYRIFRVPAGAHRISVRLRDSTRATGFDYQVTRDVNLKAGQNFSIDFKAPMGGFIFE